MRPSPFCIPRIDAIPTKGAFLCSRLCLVADIKNSVSFKGLWSESHDITCPVCVCFAPYIAHSVVFSPQKEVLQSPMKQAWQSPNPMPSLLPCQRWSFKGSHPPHRISLLLCMTLLQDRDSSGDFLQSGLEYRATVGSGCLPQIDESHYWFSLLLHWMHCLRDHLSSN